MSTLAKLLKRFMESPAKVRYASIERLLLSLGFERVPAKGSHVKWKHHRLPHDLIVPVHNGECKPFYKEQIARVIQALIPK